MIHFIAPHIPGFTELRKKFRFLNGVKPSDDHFINAKSICLVNLHVGGAL